MGASWLVFRVDRLPSRAARCGQGCHTTSRRKCPTRVFRKRHSRPGQWFQSESGLHQNWMRDYDPTTGRYIQADPLGLVDGASVYTYASSNPMRYIDPKGLADFAVGFEFDATGGTGIEGSAGIVVDTDTGMDSGVFGSIGPSAGANVGAALAAIWTSCDIEGEATGFDANTPIAGISVFGGTDSCGCEYWGLSVGVGLGLSTNASKTGTFSVRDYVNWALGR